MKRKSVMDNFKKYSIVTIIFSLFLIGVLSLSFTYTWFSKRQITEGTITFGKVNIETAYQNWDNIKLVAGSFVTDENAPTDLKIKLAADSQPVYLLVIPSIESQIEIPQAAADDGITADETELAMAVLKNKVINSFANFGVEGVHNFLQITIIVEGAERPAYIYSAAGVEPAVFNSTDEIELFNVDNFKIPQDATQAMTLPADSISGETYIVQGWCAFNLSIKLTAVQSANVGAVQGSATAAEICETLGYVVLPQKKQIEQMSWEDINLVCQLNKAQEFFDVGDEKKVMLTTGEEITLALLGFNHDDLSDGSGKAAITFGMKNLLGSRFQMHQTESNENGWNNSYMRNTHMQTFYNQMPADLKPLIKTVTKTSVTKNYVSTFTRTQDKLFLFSRVEIDGPIDSNYLYVEEGSQYEYWTTRPAEEDRIKKLTNGTSNPYFWWTRTARMTYMGFENYSSTGKTNSYEPSERYGGVSFGFCI